MAPRRPGAHRVKVTPHAAGADREVRRILRVAGRAQGAGSRLPGLAGQEARLRALLPRAGLPHQLARRRRARRGSAVRRCGPAAAGRRRRTPRDRMPAPSGCAGHRRGTPAAGARPVRVQGRRSQSHATARKGRPGGGGRACWKSWPVPVTEVADRYGASRQSVHAWLRRYREEGPSGPPLQGLRDTYTSARPMAAAIPCANSDTHPQSRRSFTENQALPCHSLSSSVPGLPGNAR
jgi:Homeodomain-like domain